MKTLYIECKMGIAGDMLMGALYELLDEPGKEGFIRMMNDAGIPGVELKAQESIRCGIKGTHMEVKVFGSDEGHHEHGHEHRHEHHHEHHGLHDIEEIIKNLNFSTTIREKALSVYDRIAEAEATVHGEKPEHIHFHEVGSLDAVADVTGCCLLMEMLDVDKIIFSPINTGSGTVHCAHGILPVPAPATALLLKGIPIYSGEIESELCTPTGAALAGAFADDFGKMPVMSISQTGYGMGTKNFEQVSCVRAMLGETEEDSLISVSWGNGQVVELAANIDDMTGEELGFAVEMLLEGGALDAYTQPIYMKKSRPAVKLCVIVQPEKSMKMAELIFRYTTTLGIRQYTCERYELKRRFEKRMTPMGEVTVKVSEGHGVKKEKYEYEELAEIARKEGISLAEVKDETVKKANE